MVVNNPLSPADATGMLAQFAEALALIAGADEASAIVTLRLLRFEPALVKFPELSAKVLSNLGTLLLRQAMMGKGSLKDLDEAIDLLEEARRLQHHMPELAGIWSQNLAAMYRQRHLRTGSGSDLMAANLVLGSLSDSDPQPLAAE